MYPTLALQGDYLVSIRTTLLKAFVDRRSPHIDRGDLIDLVSPSNPSYSVCKRVVGVEGDVVCFDPSGLKANKDEYVKVPRGYLWVAGDNLSQSTDSRDYGPVPLGLVRGKVIARVSVIAELKYDRAESRICSDLATAKMVDGFFQ